MADAPQAADKPPPELEAQPRLWWRRIPTPLIVTLVGAGLSVLILPAFTRQWDDRQKARELKAALAQQIAAATAITVGESVELRGNRSNEESAGIERRWLIRRLSIEATFRSYFSDGLLRQWKNYSAATSAFVDLASMMAFLEVGRRFEEVSSPVLREVIYSKVRRVQIRAANRPRILRLIVYKSDLFRQEAIDRIADEVLWKQERLTKNVLAANPAGFSTTRTDLLHDLLP
jgi:hypothetical protein